MQSELLQIQNVTAMASKDEYYQRIIASLQANISSQNKAISDLNPTVARQQKEIEAKSLAEYFATIL